LAAKARTARSMDDAASMAAPPEQSMVAHRSPTLKQVVEASVLLRDPEAAGVSSGVQSVEVQYLTVGLPEQ